ncbi:cell filamentation protein Fic [Methylomonas koyamae]|uniref:Cell filamentation protein Fic n=1 Tax=Methylomonas koyamae TaxID=702114 RepID=A0A177NV47_9GAMM|nr:Fic family protein [Methylomonas koyamae]OAI21153.1 cell filamentation protein Fic [Methylomonas koyamae]
MSLCQWAGYRWLAQRYNIKTVQLFRIDSQIVKSRSTERVDGFIHEFYPPAFKPEDTFVDHMTFALKREGIHLEFLARLFEAVPVTEIEEWVNAEPSGQYARRTGFFYEWLTGRQLNFKGVSVGNYVNAIDAKHYFTASNPDNNQRWRVRNNLPGNRNYCPVIYRTDKVKAAESYDCQQSLSKLEAEYGQDLLMRSAVWLTVKESQASFSIEHEDKQTDRIKRFAAVMEKYCGQIENPLGLSSLSELQAEILGSRATRYGLRQSPVFVGENDFQALTIVHYIAPHWDDTESMLSGLSEFAGRTVEKSPLVRAAVLSFGFVYIHPMADGNGRISRFLINDSLRRDQAVPAPFILPVSATIMSSSQNRYGYDQILEVLSKPLMRHYQDQYHFGSQSKGADGVDYNFYFNSYADACSVWRYPDLTAHCEYLVQIIDQTINQEMRKEAGYLRSIRVTRARIKEVLDGPDTDIDRIIRSIRNSHGKISNKLCKEFPLLSEADIGSEIIKIVQDEFGISVIEVSDQSGE